jgi:hypothetical protein
LAVVERSVSLFDADVDVDGRGVVNDVFVLAVVTVEDPIEKELLSAGLGETSIASS